MLLRRTVSARNNKIINCVRRVNSTGSCKSLNILKEKQPKLLKPTLETIKCINSYQTENATKPIEQRAVVVNTMLKPSTSSDNKNASQIESLNEKNTSTIQKTKEILKNKLTFAESDVNSIKTSDLIDNSNYELFINKEKLHRLESDKDAQQQNLNQKQRQNRKQRFCQKQSMIVEFPENLSSSPTTSKSQKFSSTINITNGMNTIKRYYQKTTDKTSKGSILKNKKFSSNISALTSKRNRWMRNMSGKVTEWMRHSLEHQQRKNSSENHHSISTTSR